MTTTCKCGKKIHEPSRLEGRKAQYPSGETVVLDGKTCRACLVQAGLEPVVVPLDPQAQADSLLREYIEQGH